MPTIGLLHTTIRGDEKMIITAAQSRNVAVELIDTRNANFNPLTYRPNFDIALERCISTTKGLYAQQFLECMGLPVVNSSRVSTLCADKFLTSCALTKANVATPQSTLVFTLEQATTAIQQLGGYPVVIKPALGSWGRLLAKINDDDALEAILEHKDVLGSPDQKAIYIQQYVQKPGRDIRAFVVNGQTIAAIYRDSSHWITNTARGGVATNCPVNSALSDICQRASTAVGGGILAMDVFETDHGYSINEINHTMEFKNSEAPTGVSISGAIVDYCLTMLDQ